MNPFQNPLVSLGGLGLALAVATAGALGTSCKPVRPLFTEGRTFAGGIQVSAHELNEGQESYMLYCYACHGENGDGHGPSSYGLRPPPRDFTKGIFKFARMASADDLPTDEDLERIVHGGLHGTAMLPWDIPQFELHHIIQFIKTFAPKRWEKKKANGDPVATIKPFNPPDDPWLKDHKGAVAEGRAIYHYKAECVNCHPGYGTKEELYLTSVEWAKKDPSTRKAMGGFRDDFYSSVPKEVMEYSLYVKKGEHGQNILPPDFTFNQLRSVRLSEKENHSAPFRQEEPDQIEDLYRIIAYGVHPVMPSWEGALTPKEIWALAHYVKSLTELADTKELAEMRASWASQAPFTVPKPVVEAKKPEEVKPAAAPAEEGAAAEKKDDEKKGDDKADDGKGEKKAGKKGDKGDKGDKGGEKKPAEKGRGGKKK